MVGSSSTPTSSTYCDQEQITFTRSRPYQKNDQCFVEQKNGAVVRQFVGYDRFEGEPAYRQLVELYRALRLYVNFFQPSMKLKEKRRRVPTSAELPASPNAVRTPLRDHGRVEERRHAGRHLHRARSDPPA